MGVAQARQRPFLNILNLNHSKSDERRTADDV
jgi:hypothetical protein